MSILLLFFDRLISIVIARRADPCYIASCLQLPPLDSSSPELDPHLITSRVTNEKHNIVRVPLCSLHCRILFCFAGERKQRVDGDLRRVDIQGWSIATPLRPPASLLIVT